MFFGEIFKQLEHHKIRYLLIGGVAVNLHGFSRTTDDLDLWIDLEKKNVIKFFKMLQTLEWKPKIPESIESLGDPKKRRNWIKEKDMKVFSIYNPNNFTEQADIVVREYIDFKSAYKRREEIMANNIKISLISIPDLIRLKKIAARERDIIDIKALKRIKELKNAKKRKI